jgi:hypothetical protein
MGRLLNEICVQDVGELRTLLDVLPEDMPVGTDGGGMLRVRIYEKDDLKYLEVE